jgi:flagellar hook assembly protein FlgD
VLFQNYPNPFYPITTITFDLHTESNVELVIYNVEGKRIKTLVNGQQRVGVHEIPWNGLDDSGNRVASGVYLYRLKTRETIQTKKMILLR